MRKSFDFYQFNNKTVFQKTSAGILPVDIIKKDNDYEIIMTQGKIEVLKQQIFRYRKRGRNMTKVTVFGLIGTAVTVIIYSIPGLPKIESSLGPLFPVALLIFFTIENLMKKRL